MNSFLGLIHKRPLAGPADWLGGMRSLLWRGAFWKSGQTLLQYAYWMATCALFLTLSGRTAAASVTIGWDLVPSSVVAGYRIYYGPVGLPFLGVVDAGPAALGVVTGLTEGVTYRFAVASYNALGTESVLSSEVVSTPRLAPVVQLMLPISGSVFSTSSSVILVAEVISNGNLITGVEFLVDGMVVGQDATVPYSCTWTGGAEGPHQVGARVFYNVSNVVTSVLSPISVVAAPPGNTGQVPVVTLTSPADGSVRSTPLSIGLAASVQANGHVISRVQFFNGSRLVGEDSTAPYTCTWAGVSAGTYGVVARAIYGAGLVQSSAVSTVLVQDPPVIELTSPTNGTLAYASVPLVLQANVVANGHVISKVRFYSGTTLLGEDTVAPFTWQWAGVGEGSYSITARLYYGAGSTMWSAPSLVQVTTAAPTVQMDGFLNGGTYAYGSDISFRGVVAANGHALAKVQFLRDGEWMGETVGPEYVWVWRGATTGQSTWVARLLYDSGLSVQSDPVTLTVNPPQPGIQLSSPLNESSHVVGSPVNLQATVQANGNPLSKVEFMVDGVAVGESLGPIYAMNWIAPTVGVSTVTARLTYGSGAVVTSSPVLVALTQPPPTLRLVSPVEGSVYPSGQVVSLQSSLTLNGNSPSKVQYLANGQLLGETTGPGGVWEWTGPQPGEYSLVARLYYNGTRFVDSVPVGISVVNTPPTVEWAPGVDGAAFASGTAIPLSVVIQANGTVLGSVEYVSNGAWIATVTQPPYAWLWTNAPVGAHLLTARLNYPGGSPVLTTPASLWVGELPPPWMSKDLQPDALPGASSLSNSVFRISGAGVVNGTRDSARFVYQTLSGDGEISACIVSTLPTGRAGSVGVMMRESLGADSRHVLMGIAASGEWRWQRRDETGGLTWTGNYAVSSLPRAWVRLVRVGNLFSGYSSVDGVNWTLQNTRTLLMPATIHFGMVVSSGSATTSNTAEFSSVIAQP